MKTYNTRNVSLAHCHGQLQHYRLPHDAAFIALLSSPLDELGDVPDCIKIRNVSLGKGQNSSLAHKRRQ